MPTTQSSRPMSTRSLRTHDLNSVQSIQIFPRADAR
jgi:hypothetical protein